MTNSLENCTKKNLLESDINLRENIVVRLSEETVEDTYNEFLENVTPKAISSAKICYILTGIGAKDLRLSQQNIGKKELTFFDNDFGWCFQNEEDALKIAKKHTRQRKEINVSPYLSERATRKWYGSNLEKKAVGKETKYLIAHQEANEKKKHIVDTCNKTGFDISFLYEDKPPDNFSDLQKNTYEILKKDFFPDWIKDQKLCEELKKEWDDVEEEIKNNPSGDIEYQIVEKLNKIHAVVRHTQTYFLREEPHTIFGGMDFVLESKQSIKDFYENKIIECSDGNFRTEAEIWIKSPNRREYNGITFDPTGNAEKMGLYNIWKGFPLEPSKNGSCKHFKEFTKNVICSGNLEFFEYLWFWMSMLVQKPHEIPEIAILLMGLQGTGKGFFAKTLGRLFGQHFLQLDNMARLLGNFNNHMRNAVLVFADESIWEGGKKDIGKLKAMITEETAVIEPKGKDLFTIKNYRHFIFSSNEDFPVHLDHDDRRFLVLKVSSKHKEDYGYFKAISNELENDGYERLLYELQTESISNFNPRKIPLNVDAFDVKMQGASSVENYLFNALKEGSFDIGNASPSFGWKDKILIKSVYNDYSAWCSKEQIQHKINNSRLFGKKLFELLKSTTKTRPSVPQGVKQEYYCFPDLQVTRTDFEKAYKVDSTIWN